MLYEVITDTVIGGTLTVTDVIDGMTNPNFTVTGAATNGVASIDPRNNFV